MAQPEREAPPARQARARYAGSLSHAGRVKSRNWAHASPTDGAELEKEGTRGQAQNWMAPMAIDFNERHKDEGAPVHLRVRQDQPPALTPGGGPAPPPTGNVENVDIETARTPVAPDTPPRAPLDRLDKPQHRCRGEGHLELEHGIDIGRLAPEPQGFGCISSRYTP